MRHGPSIYTRLKIKYIKLILQGVKISKDNEKNSKRYNYYNYYIGLITLCYLSYYVPHNYFNPEYKYRRRSNILIPRSVYDVRRKHYVYWDLSRVARGKSKFFSYYNYDNESKLLNFVDRNGNSFIEKVLFNEERPDIMINPFLERLIKLKPWNDEMLSEANDIYAYYKNINKRFDLDVNLSESLELFSIQSYKSNGFYKMYLLHNYD